MKPFYFKTALTWLLSILISVFTYLSLQALVTDVYSGITNRIIALVVGMALLLSVMEFKGYSRSGLARVMLLWSGWTIFITLFINGNASTTVKMLFWQATFYCAYLLLRDSPSRIRIFRVTFAVIAVLAAVYTYLAREISEIAQALNEMGQGSEDFYETALNIVFYPLLTIPWILIIKKGLLRNLLLLIVLLSIVLSVKRSAVLASALIVLVYLLFYSRFSVNRHKRLLRLVIPLLLIGSVFYFTDRYMSDTGDFIVERMHNIQEDKGSGRLRIYEQVLDHLSMNRADEWLFGHGHYTVIQHIPMHKSAHNDFLEVLFDYGLIGLAIYLCLHLLLISQLWRLYKNSSQYFVSYLASYIIFFIMSMVSHLIIYPTYFIYLGTYWGAMEALIASDRHYDDHTSRLLPPFVSERDDRQS